MSYRSIKATLIWPRNFDLLEAPFIIIELLGLDLAKSDLTRVRRCFFYLFFLIIYFYLGVLIYYLISLALLDKISSLSFYVSDLVITYSS